jgi:arabinogalactan endo-1,4-beta-galactosidase
MKDNSKKEVPVTWNNVDYDAMKNGGVAKYTIKGIADGMAATCYVSMVEYNFLQNWSFEDDDKGTGWTANAIVKSDELKVEDKVSDSLTGTKHYHFYSATANSVEFTLEQSIANLKTGAYKYSISVMGESGGTIEIYAYVKINGEIVSTADTTLTVYNEWHTATIEDITYADGDTITVGIYVKCTGAGAWGKIDDALLNSVTE